jgi:hypothetical protein
MRFLAEIYSDAEKIIIIQDNLGNRIKVGSVSHGEEFLGDIEKMCDVKGIPFEKPRGPIRFFNL